MTTQEMIDLIALIDSAITDRSNAEPDFHVSSEWMRVVDHLEAATERLKDMADEEKRGGVSKSLFEKTLEKARSQCVADLRADPTLDWESTVNSALYNCGIDHEDKLLQFCAGWCFGRTGLDYTDVKIDSECNGTVKQVMGQICDTGMRAYLNLQKDSIIKEAKETRT